MASVPIDDTDTKMSELIARAIAGEEIILTRGDAPVAKIVALEAPTGKRQFGAMRGEFVVGPAFFEPLPEAELALWE